MALDLQAQPLSLFDPIGGARDLESRRLRLIHPGSARDDPTRGLRAARYANRLGFRIEAQSARWIREAAAQGALRTISADRLRRELEKIFEEPRAGGALRLLEGLGLLRAIHPALRGDAAARRRADAAAGIARRMGAPLAASVVRALARELSRPALAELAGRLGFTGEGASRLEGWPARLRQLGRPSRLAPSKVDRWIGEALPEEIAAAAASLPVKDRLAMMCAQRLRATMKARVTGGEIVGAGVPPGPWIAGALAAARAARLDGRIVPGKEKAYAIATARRRAARRG
jgi:tRNA nucleotidyltransferase/poly(A) polymerase